MHSYFRDSDESYEISEFAGNCIADSIHHF